MFMDESCKARSWILYTSSVLGVPVLDEKLLKKGCDDKLLFNNIVQTFQFCVINHWLIDMIINVFEFNIVTD